MLKVLKTNHFIYPQSLLLSPQAPLPPPPRNPNPNPERPLPKITCKSFNTHASSPLQVPKKIF